MKKKFIFIVMLLALACLPSLLSAQDVAPTPNDTPSNPIIFVSKDKAGDEIVKVMNETRIPFFREPKTPRFLLTDTRGRFALGIGGYIEAVSEYDFNGIIKNPDFYPSLMPAKGSTAVRNQYQMNIANSTIILKMVGRTKKLGYIVVYFNGNFSGNNYGFQLQNAYVQFAGFTLGYNLGTFMDPSVCPTTIDFAGPCGVAFYRVAQIAYTYNRLKNWTFRGAIERPVVDATFEADASLKNTTQSASQRMPNFVVSAQYKWGSGNHIQTAALIRSMTYDSFNNKDDISAKSTLGWGAQLSSTINITQNLDFLGQINYGKGIGLMINDLSNLDVDLVPDPDNPSKMQALPMLGWYAGLQYNFNPNVYVSSTYSASRVYSANGWPIQNSETYRYGQYFVCSAFWNINSNLQLGIEYLRGWRTYFQKNSTDHANRINLMAQYSF